MEKPHKKLEAWKLSMDLVVEIYRLTSKFPSLEKFGLVDQMRRAAVSVPSNVAEGAARQTKREFINFLHISQGSLSELDTQIELGRRLRYLEDEAWGLLDRRMERIDRLITGLIRHLNRK
jgi:four helix bundle protein